VKRTRECRRTEILFLASALIAGFLLTLALEDPARAAEPTAAPLNAREIMTRMKAALEPPRPSLRTVEFIVHSEDGHENRWLGREARKHGPNGDRVLLVMVEPPDLRGTALLIRERPDAPDEQWMWTPAVRRVRMLYPINAFHPFLFTDFTYADLGFVDLRARSLKLEGTEQRDGRSIYRVVEVPQSRWYYSRIVDWIAADDLLPIQRNYYSPSGELWKTMYFENVTIVQGVPTPTRLRMEDRKEGSYTELRIKKVTYDAEIPEAVFEPSALPDILSNPVWGAAE